MNYKYIFLILINITISISSNINNPYSSTSISSKAFDFYQLTNSQNLNCAFKNGYKYAIIRSSRSNGAFDKNSPTNLQLANKAGIKTDVYIFPCAGKNAAVQIYNMINKLENQLKLFETVYIDIEKTQGVTQACQWSSYSPQANCQFVEQLVRAIKTKRKKVAFYSNRVGWVYAFKNSRACSKFQQYPLWYPRYNNILNFQDFEPFGGWVRPSMKQYKGNTKLCNMTVDLNIKF